MTYLQNTSDICYEKDMYSSLTSQEVLDILSQRDIVRPGIMEHCKKYNATHVIHLCSFFDHIKFILFSFLSEHLIY